MRHLAPTLIVALTSAATAQEKITYDDHVRTIFEDKCFSCHNPDTAKGGLDLTSYGNTMAGGGAQRAADNDTLSAGQTVGGGAKFKLWSNGPDKQSNTEDDIRNWSEEG